MKLEPPARGTTWIKPPTSVRGRLLFLMIISAVPVTCMAGFIAWQNYRIVASHSDNAVLLAQESALARYEAWSSQVHRAMAHIALKGVGVRAGNCDQAGLQRDQEMAAGLMATLSVASAPTEDPKVIEHVLEEFPRLKRLLDRRGGALSGGEQQLLALARCLIAKPKLVLLDEPTEGIQPSIIEEIVETLLRLKKTWALSMIIVEQNLDFITSLSDRILQIQKGRITGEVSAQDLSSGHFGMTAA